MAASSSGKRSAIDSDGNPRGGRQQRKRMRETETETIPESGQLLNGNVLDSHLALSLLKKWAWGDMSAVQVQHIAHQSYKDQIGLLNRAGSSREHVTSSIYNLASLGSWGRISGNIAKELRNMIGEPALPQPVMHDLNSKIEKPRLRMPTVRRSPFGFMLPHVMFSFLFNNQKSTFMQKMAGVTESISNMGDKLETFWREVVKRKDPRIIRHPMCLRTGWMRRAIPLVIHGDAVPVIRVGKPGTRSLDCISFQSLLAFGPSLSIKFLMFSIFDKSKLKGFPNRTDTMIEVWKILMHSFVALFEGKHPAADHNKKAWTHLSSDALLADTFLCSEDESFFGVIWSITGDLDWYAKDLMLNNYNSVLPCPYDPVGTNKEKPMWPTNFNKNAPWKKMQHTASEWRAQSRAVQHPLFAIFIFLTMLNVEADELHILYLGIHQYFLGSILWLMTYKYFTGPLENRIQSIWILILNQYRLQGTDHQFTHMGVSSFLDPQKPTRKFPRLKGRGAEIKGLVDPLLAVWNNVRTASAHDKCVTHALEALSCMQRILDEHKYDLFFTPAASQEFIRQTDAFLLDYSWLGVQADSRSELLFSGVPKLHWLWHMADRSLFLNPRRVACFTGEDFVKHMKKIAVKSSAGTALHKIPLTVMQKHRWGVHLESFSPPEG